MTPVTVELDKCEYIDRFSRNLGRGPVCPPACRWGPLVRNRLTMSGCAMWLTVPGCAVRLTLPEVLCGSRFQKCCAAHGVMVTPCGSRFRKCCAAHGVMVTPCGSRCSGRAPRGSRCEDDAVRLTVSGCAPRGLTVAEWCRGLTVSGCAPRGLTVAVVPCGSWCQGAPRVAGPRRSPPSRGGRACPFRPNCPGGDPARLLSAEVPQLISCGTSAYRKPPTIRPRPARRRHAPTRCRRVPAHRCRVPARWRRGPRAGAASQPAHGPHAYRAPLRQQHCFARPRNPNQLAGKKLGDLTKPQVTRLAMWGE